MRWTVLGLVLGVAVAGAGGVERTPALLGTTADVTASPLCRAGCRLTFEGPEMASPLTRKYRLPDGAELAVIIYPQSKVVTNARLLFPDGALTPARRELARQFLEQFSGRRFPAAGLDACFRAAQASDPEASNAVLSRWATPAGYQFKARCGVRFTAGVWLGWQQQ